jgi:ATP-dependent DNA helicase RecG
MLNIIESSIQYLKGISSKRVCLFRKLGVNSLYDLLSFFPIAYQDRTKIVPIKDLIYNNQGCIFVKIGNSYQKRLSANLSILEVEVYDSKFHGYLRFFRNNKSRFRDDIISYLKKIFVQNSFAYIYGEAKEEYGNIIITPTDYEIVKDELTTPLHFKKIIPVYAATEGLKQKFIREFIKTTLNSYSDFYPNLLRLIPDSYNIHKMKVAEAIKKIHYPKSLQEAELARQSFALQEFLILETALLLSRNNFLQKNKVQKYKIKKTLLSAFKNNLNFEFTKDQKKAINDIFFDMQSQKTMNRMLMGDVGSGKTIVALAAILLAIENGYQTMIIAPTEVLAEQHYITIFNILKGLDITIALLTSSLLKKQKEREYLLEGLNNGQIQLAIGTHSLIEDRIKFKNLSLIVIDEQHRFGVRQKFAALYKANSPDVLMMTATPIPRALAMTVYGEIDITTIKHLPNGRIPVKTFLSTEVEAYANTIKELKKGNQAYIVYPIIEESDKLALRSAIQDFEKLSKGYFKAFKIALLHGKMKPQEKNLIMKKFKSKEFDVLVSTTVIEVGIDVPDSTVIVIHNAERFGLSALHQLRGRVGRSEKQSYAYLISSSNSQNANERLSIMTSTNDGFQIAQKDLEMRGPGELMGTIQHGFPTFKAANLVTDADIIEISKDIAKNILKDDPHLLNPKNLLLKNLITKHFSSKTKFITVA